VVAAGGVPVMAHPLARRRGRVVDDAVIEQMADAGLAGLEVYHRDHDHAEREHLLALARRLDLLVTGSSDYHGAGKPNRLGENTTDDEVLAEIERRATGSAVVG
ncbi:MAG TPA: phosphatase, partial [Angustibacter sp.]|nr:phosphatase [Angustibacter sp.]